jgi:hypothetical protein
MKSSLKVFSFLIVLLCLVACNSSTSNAEKKEKNPIKVEEPSKELKFANRVTEIHKKDIFSNEDFVRYHINYQIGNLKDELKVVAKTDLNLVEVTSENFGKVYYNGQNLLLDPSANMGDQEAKRIFTMIYFYHSFFFLDHESLSFSSINEVKVKGSLHKKLDVNNEILHTSFIPKETSFFVEDRTNMLKGLEIKTSLFNNSRKLESVYLSYNRFITVNHVPVSLNWKLYPSENISETSQIGEAQITKIKFYTSDRIQLSIPENAQVVKNSPIL